MLEQSENHESHGFTPIIHLWEGVLAVPIVGLLDTARSQAITETLLQELSSTNSSVTILDISGVSTVDTDVAMHLLKTIDAVRLMGAECVISGIRPEIAQTMVNLGIDLKGVRTRGSMARALEEALLMLGFRVVPIEGQSA